jgi:hypothetical protein
MVVALAWLLAPIDFGMTWIRWYKEAEEARRRQNVLDTKDFGDEKIF